MIHRFLPLFFWSGCRVQQQLTAIDSKATMLGISKQRRHPKAIKATREKKICDVLWKYTINGLRKTLPAILNSVSLATIHWNYLHCMQIIDAYGSRATYDTMKIKKWVYKTHWQIADKSK